MNISRRIAFTEKLTLYIPCFGRIIRKEKRKKKRFMETKEKKEKEMEIKVFKKRANELKVQLEKTEKGEVPILKWKDLTMGE